MDWYWALGVASALSGVWWLVFAYFAFQRLPDRPGPPFPPGMSKYTEGWRRTHRLLVYLWRSERNTFYFLILFFIFSDGYSTISTVAVMFAYHELCMVSFF
jgi:MFS transporter, UMF1 family